MKVKEIIIKIDDDVFANIKNRLVIRRMVDSFEEIESFAYMIIEAIEKGEKTLGLISKKKHKKRKD